MIYCSKSNILLNYHSRQHVFCLNSNNLNCIQTLTKSYLFEKFLSVMRCWCLGAYTGIIGAKVALLSNFQRKDPVSKSALMDQIYVFWVSKMNIYINWGNQAAVCFFLYLLQNLISCIWLVTFPWCAIPEHNKCNWN